MTDPDYRQQALDVIKSLDPVSPKMLSFPEQLQIATIYAILGASDVVRQPSSVELDPPGLDRQDRSGDGPDDLNEVIVTGTLDATEHVSTDRELFSELATAYVKISPIGQGQFADELHESSSQSEGAATPSDDTVEEPADEGGQAGRGTSQPRSAPADLTPRGICFEYRQDVNHRYWIERDGEQYAATVMEDVLPGEHTVTPIDGPDKHFTDLDEAIAWAKNHILDAANQARKEQS